MRRRAVLAAACVLGAGMLLAAPAGAQHVNVATISGSINPASSDYLQRAIEQSEQDGAAALLIELDTPGGLLASTKDIIQAMLNARVPIVVFVSPQGAWAGSAGTFITLAGHVAAMAPGTSIGAAHPVGIGGGGQGEGEEGKRDFAAEKAENFTAAFIESIAKQRERNVEWAVKAVRESVAIAQDEALELNVIDVVAPTSVALMDAIHGREVPVAGEQRTLDVRDAELRPVEWKWVNRVLNVLASPDLAMLLLMAGMLGLYIEFSNPGLIVPGVIGGSCLMLALISLQILPFSWLGLLLLAAGVVLFVLEVFVTSYGLLFAGGLACMLVGGSMLFDLPTVSDLNVSFWSVLVPAVSAFGIFGALVVFALGRSMVRKQSAGVQEMIGSFGTAVTDLEPDGTVFVHGEHWRALAEASVASGERVEITAVEGLRLRVRRAPPES